MGGVPGGRDSCVFKIYTRMYRLKPLHFESV